MSSPGEQLNRQITIGLKGWRGLIESSTGVAANLYQSVEALVNLAQSLTDDQVQSLVSLLKRATVERGKLIELLKSEIRSQVFSEDSRPKKAKALAMSSIMDMDGELDRRLNTTSLQVLEPIFSKLKESIELCLKKLEESLIVRFQSAITGVSKLLSQIESDSALRENLVGDIVCTDSLATGITTAASCLSLFEEIHGTVEDVDSHADFLLFEPSYLALVTGTNTEDAIDSIARKSEQSSMQLSKLIVRIAQLLLNTQEDIDKTLKTTAEYAKSTAEDIDKRLLLLKTMPQNAGAITASFQELAIGANDNVLLLNTIIYKLEWLSRFLSKIPKARESSGLGDLEKTIADLKEKKTELEEHIAKCRDISNLGPVAAKLHILYDEIQKIRAHRLQGWFWWFKGITDYFSNTDAKLKESQDRITAAFDLARKPEIQVDIETAKKILHDTFRHEKQYVEEVTGKKLETPDTSDSRGMNTP